MEADRLEMCSMMWLKEHETCSPMDAVHSATREKIVIVIKCSVFLCSRRFSFPLLIV